MLFAERINIFAERVNIILDIVFDLITAHSPIRAQSSNSVVSRLPPVYFLSTSLYRGSYTRGHFI